MSMTIELPDELYQDLEREWRESEAAVDSTEESRSGHARTPFGELIARKFERQGLHRL